MRAVVLAAVLASLFAVAPASAQVTRIYPDNIYIEQPAAAVSRHVRRRSVRHVGKRRVRHAVRHPGRVVRQRTTVVRPVRGSRTLPARSGVEVRTNEINRSLTNQGQALQQQQQNQFEINQLRQGIDRQSVTGPPTIGSPTGGRICPPGATGC
jgi:RNase P protein component